MTTTKPRPHKIMQDPAVLEDLKTLIAREFQAHGVTAEEAELEALKLWAGRVNREISEEISNPTEAHQEIDEATIAALAQGDMERQVVVRDETKLADLKRRRSEYRAAIAVQERQVRDRQSRANQAILREAVQLDREVIRQYAIGLIQAGLAVDRRHEVTSTLEAAGLSWNGPIEPYPFHDTDPREKNGLLAQRLRKWVAAGVIAADDVPEEWRRRWGW